MSTNQGDLIWSDEFNSEPQVNQLSWDLDENGLADALTDGLLLLRHTFGLRGSSLFERAVSINSPLTTGQVESNIDLVYDVADIDNNGRVDALTDGLMLLRYLFGLRGASLIDNVIAVDAMRTDADAVEAYIESLMPEF